MRLVEVECCNCGIIFGMTEERDNRLRKTHEFFHCPSGHSQYYSGKSDEERLKEQIRDKDTRIASLLNEVSKLKEPPKKKRGRPRKK